MAEDQDLDFCIFIGQKEKRELGGDWNIHLYVPV